MSGLDSPHSYQCLPLLPVFHTFLPSSHPPWKSFIHSFIPLFVCMGAQRSQKRDIGALELEIKEVVRLITWVLATKLKSSACEPSFQLLTHLSRPQIPFLGGSFYFFLCICMCTPMSVSVVLWNRVWLCDSLLLFCQPPKSWTTVMCSVDCLSLEFWQQGVVIQFSGLRF